MSPWLWIGSAAATTLPGFYLRFSGNHVNPTVDALVYGFAIVGAAFLLSWAAEVAEMDISQSLALAFLALVAVLPEYAVDLYFAWTAASDPIYAHYAVANMTGANRLLIGVGWALVVALYWLKRRSGTVELERHQSVEIFFLVVATAYALIVPLKGSLSLLDTLVFGGLFFVYLWRAARVPSDEPELVGPAVVIAALAPAWRRTAVVFLFLFSATVILSAAEPFAEGLIATGKGLGIDEFLLVQWLAPLASEAPEVVVAALFTLRGRPTAGLGTLVSSKVNQWTLLVGSLPLVYSLGLGRPGALPLDGRQVEEIFLTAAQSAFAVTLIANLRLSTPAAVALFTLFATQLFFSDPTVRYAYAASYLAVAVVVLAIDGRRRRGLLNLWKVTWGKTKTPAPKPGHRPRPGSSKKK